MTARTFDRLLPVEQDRPAYLLRRQRCGDPIGLQLLFPGFTHPVGRPRRRKNRLDPNILKPMFQQDHPDTGPYHIHRRTATIRRRYDDLGSSIHHPYIPDNTQVDHGQYRNLGVAHFRQQIPDLPAHRHIGLFGHHFFAFCFTTRASALPLAFLLCHTRFCSATRAFCFYHSQPG